MSIQSWLLAGLLACLAVYVLFVVGLLIAGRRGDARALAGFVPDCVIFFGWLARDARIPRWRRALLFLLLGYLALPIDLVPDFIPVAGQLDDAILVALVLRTLLREGGPELILDLWPGPPQSRDVMLRLAGA